MFNGIKCLNFYLVNPMGTLIIFLEIEYAIGILSIFCVL